MTINPDVIPLWFNVVAWLGNAFAWTFVSHSLFMSGASLALATLFAYLARKES